MNAATRIVKELSESQADARAYRLATEAAEEFIRCNGISTDVPDQFIITGADVADEYAVQCIEHLKWVGECVAFEQGDDVVVLLGDYTLESLA